ncbi:hypothetical protein [Natronospora cellulosivora (SeqCode)]
MVNQKSYKKNIRSYMKKVFIILLVCSAFTSFVLANGAHLTPGSIKIDIDFFADAAYANNNLRVRRHKADDINIYYQIADKYIEGVNLAEYLMVKTPYANHYQSMDQAVLFLENGDNQVEISIKFRIDRNIWRILSRLQDKKIYRLDLVSENGASITINLHVHIRSSFTVSPNEINIIADNGPGFYQAEEHVRIDIDMQNSNWNLLIEAKPLHYQDYTGNNGLFIEKEDLYISIDGSENFHSLAVPYQISGSNYGNKANIDLILETEIKWEHLAGNYLGEVIITISE